MSSDELFLDPSEEELQAEQAHLLNMHALELHKAKAPPATVLTFQRRALALQPDSAEIWANLGLTYWRLHDWTNARISFERAVRLSPRSHIHHGNLGVFSSSTGNAEAAERHLAEAARLAPDALGPVWDTSLLNLWQGKWDQGFGLYDVRIPHRGPELYPKMPYPIWNGEPLDGKSIYIQGEQGTGDMILFSRYIAWLHEQYPTCKMHACFGALANLFWGFSPFVNILPPGVPWPEGIDYSVFLASLPRFHKSQPDFVPPDPGLIRQRFQMKGAYAKIRQPILPALRVGIVWAGNPGQARNEDRCIPLEMLLPLAEDPRIALCSLQVGPGRADIDRLFAGEIVEDFGLEIEKEGWVGTGIVLKQIDLLITVCTGIAHLAGSLGTPCWTLLCKEPYWIWPRTGSTTNWYPGMRLFRQKDMGDWKPVIDEVSEALTDLADTRLG